MPALRYRSAAGRLDAWAAVMMRRDGLVDAGIWPADTPDWVTTTEPVLNVVGRKTVPQVIITLTERAA